MLYKWEPALLLWISSIVRHTLVPILMILKSEYVLKWMGPLMRLHFFSLSLSKSCFLASCAFYSWRHLGNKVINLYSITDSDTLWHLTLNSRSLSFWGKSLLRENWGSGGKKTDTGSHSSCHATIKMLTWIYLEKYRQILSPQTSLLPPVFKYPADTLQGVLHKLCHGIYFSQ